LNFDFDFLKYIEISNPFYSPTQPFAGFIDRITRLKKANFAIFAARSRER